MARGGKREGAGRRKGARNAITQKRRDVAVKALDAERTPLGVMLEAMNAAYDTGGPLAAASFAKECAPYVHPKLANVSGQFQGDLKIELVSFADATGTHDTGTE